MAPHGFWKSAIQYLDKCIYNMSNMKMLKYNLIYTLLLCDILFIIQLELI